jgi:hypothetical protein
MCVLVTWLEQLASTHSTVTGQGDSYSGTCIGGEIIGAVRLIVIRAVSGDFQEMDARFTVTRRVRQEFDFWFLGEKGSRGSRSWRSEHVLEVLCVMTII